MSNLDMTKFIPLQSNYMSMKINTFFRYILADVPKNRNGYVSPCSRNDEKT